MVQGNMVISGVANDGKFKHDHYVHNVHVTAGRLYLQHFAKKDATPGGLLASIFNTQDEKVLQRLAGYVTPQSGPNHYRLVDGSDPDGRYRARNYGSLLVMADRDENGILTQSEKMAFVARVKQDTELSAQPGKPYQGNITLAGTIYQNNRSQYIQDLRVTGSQVLKQYERGPQSARNLDERQMFAELFNITDPVIQGRLVAMVSNLSGGAESANIDSNEIAAMLGTADTNKDGILTGVEKTAFGEKMTTALQSDPPPPGFWGNLLGGKKTYTPSLQDRQIDLQREFRTTHEGGPQELIPPNRVIWFASEEARGKQGPFDLMPPRFERPELIERF